MFQVSSAMPEQRADPAIAPPMKRLKTRSRIFEAAPGGSGSIFPGKFSNTFKPATEHTEYSAQGEILTILNFPILTPIKIDVQFLVYQGYHILLINPYIFSKDDSCQGM